MTKDCRTKDGPSGTWIFLIHTCVFAMTKDCRTRYSSGGTGMDISKLYLCFCYDERLQEKRWPMSGSSRDKDKIQSRRFKLGYF